MEYVEPTIEEVRRMKTGDGELVERFLPYMLMMTEIEIVGRPQREAAAARFEAFKQKVMHDRAHRHYFVDGAGI